MTSPHAKVFQYVESREPTIFINRLVLQAYKDGVAKLKLQKEQAHEPA